LGHALNHCQCSKICPKLPKFAKICPKIINLRNFEIPPKAEILVFFKKNQCIKEAPEHVLIIWIFNRRVSHILFYCQKMAFVCEFQHYFLVQNDAFLKVPHLPWI
jgi:hypothetical protein